jgi:muramoyltetrapeptide carboxypeptidase
MKKEGIDFQQMLDDHSIKAILCARGGYGIVRIIDQLDLSEFRKIRNGSWFQ